MKRTILIAVLLVGRACGGWLNPSQPGFTADETLLRIAGDRTNAAALTDATNGLWQALGGHNHDGRYDLAGAANAASNRLSGALLSEAAARSAFDANLQETNGLVLYGQDLYRETVVDGAPGWLDWQVWAVEGQPTVLVWAHWENVIHNSDGSLDSDQLPDFGGADYGQFAWILDPAGNYRVPQEWHAGDRFANVGPDASVACTWNGYGWDRGETVVDDTVIDAVDTGYYGSDFMGWYEESTESAVVWHVSDNRRHISYSIDWHPATDVPLGSPWYLDAQAVHGYIKIRPVVDDALIWDSFMPGVLCSPDGVTVAGMGGGPIDPPIEMSAGYFFGYSYAEWWPNAYGETSVFLDNPWFYGCERQRPWVQVPTANEVAVTVQDAITGDQTRYLKGEVDSIAQSVRDDLGSQVQAARDDLGGQMQAARADLGAQVAASTNLLAPTLVGQYQSATFAPDSTRVITVAWSNSPFVSVQNTNAVFLVLPPMPPPGQVANLYFDCLGTNTIFFTRPVFWEYAPPSGKGLYQLFGNASSTNTWRGWGMSEIRMPFFSYLQFSYAVPPGSISNGIFSNPVGLTIGKGASTNTLPATVGVLCKQQPANYWTALPLSRTNLYAGDVCLPFGRLRVAYSNSADVAINTMPSFAVASGYHLEFNGDGAYWDLNARGSWGQSDGYPAYAAWYFNGTQTDGTWGGFGQWFIDNQGTAPAPGFSHRCYRAGSWGGSTMSAAIRSPAITGLVTQVRMFVKVQYEGINGVVEYCPLTADWTQKGNWSPLGPQIPAGDWQWVTYPVAKTNGYIRFRVTPASQNSAPFSIAYFEIN